MRGDGVPVHGPRSARGPGSRRGLADILLRVSLHMAAFSFPKDKGLFPIAVVKTPIFYSVIRVLIELK